MRLYIKGSRNIFPLYFINARIKISVILFLVFILFSFNLSAVEKGFSRYWIKGKPYVNLHALARSYEINTGYDMETGRVKLYYMGNRSVIANGYCFIVVNGTLVRSKYPVMKKSGEIFLPEKTALSLLSVFFPDKKPLRKNNSYILVEKGGGRISPPAEKKAKNFPITFIIIDPGHGGKDPGAIGKGGLKEKDITLNISKLVRNELKSQLRNTEIIMTRYSDRFVELSRRTEVANRKLRKSNNGIFLSIHINASISRRISGYETYFLSQNPSNEDARSTAALENNVIVYEKGKNRKEKYGDIEYIVAHMMTTQIQRESSMLAETVQVGMSSKNRYFKSRGVRKADFFVLRGALMPAVLVEVGFITNSKESKWLTRSSHQKRIARGISAGILNFLKKYNRTVR